MAKEIDITICNCWRKVGIVAGPYVDIPPYDEEFEELANRLEIPNAEDMIEESAPTFDMDAEWKQHSFPRSWAWCRWRRGGIRKPKGANLHILNEQAWLILRDGFQDRGGDILSIIGVVDDYFSKLALNSSKQSSIIDFFEVVTTTKTKEVPTPKEPDVVVIDEDEKDDS